ncbi:hypothetical protein CCACVL1_08067 [Corchorus capsularis]|uniref:Uncharacterized protein n=1 Tax=Corchorus capsularis TaxID=210143 RepID=A0A1R3J2D5_COCAP|nr:hypothetical protein CCACVL1_08067 [Corchorus capsularis]
MADSVLLLLKHGSASLDILNGRFTCIVGEVTLRIDCYQLMEDHMDDYETNNDPHLTSEEVEDKCDRMSSAENHAETGNHAQIESPFPSGDLKMEQT